MAAAAGPKQKKTHVVRYYGKENTDNEDFWVDVETLDRITFNGRQGNISNKNQAQETTVNLADFAKDPGRKLFTVRVRNPQDDNQYIDIDINGTIEVNTRSKFQYQKTGRWFDSGFDNKSRKFLPLRIINNNIDDQYLTEVTDKKETAAEKTVREEAESHTGKKTGTVANITGHNTGRKTKQPPTDPDKYLEVVRKTNNKDEDQYLSVQLIDTFGISRATSAQYQAVEFNGMWNNCLLYKPEGKSDDRATQAKIDDLVNKRNTGKITQSQLNDGLDAIQKDRIMPGVKEDPQAGGADPIRLDPLQVIVNFGSGGLAVEFGDKAKDAPRKKK